MRVIDALDTPLRRGELARALGYWAARYREGQPASPLPSPRTCGWRWCGPRRTAPADVETVIVGGDVVKRDGKLAGDHVGHALELMHAARERLRA